VVQASPYSSLIHHWTSLEGKGSTCSLSPQIAQAISYEYHGMWGSSMLSNASTGSTHLEGRDLKSQFYSFEGFQKIKHYYTV
jgi:hypothetical protein